MTTTKKIKVGDMFNLDVTGLKDYPQLALKLKGMFEAVGVKKVENNLRIEESTHLNNLTVVVYPNFRFSGNQIGIGYGDNGTPQRILYEKIRDMPGYADNNIFNSFTGTREKIMINVGSIISKKEIEIGCYLKDRNMVILYYDIFNTYKDRALQSSSLLLFFTNHIINYIKKKKIKAVDISKIIKKKTLESFSKAIRNSIKIKEDDTVAKKRNIEDYEKTIIDYLKRIQINSVEIVAIQKLLKNVDGYVSKQIDEIKKLNFVKKIDLTSEGLVIDLGKIFIPYSKKKVYIDEFILTLNPSKIKIVSKNPIEGPYHHPHISGSSVCFGSRGEEIRKLLANNEFKKIVHIIYLYLQSYNTSDSYRKIENWIRRNEKEDEKKKTVKLKVGSSSSTPRVVVMDEASEISRAQFDSIRRGM